MLQREYSEIIKHIQMRPQLDSYNIMVEVDRLPSIYPISDVQFFEQFVIVFDKYIPVSRIQSIALYKGDEDNG
jgi:hypothetical protein